MSHHGVKVTTKFCYKLFWLHWLKFVQMIYIWQNLDQGNTKITENNFPILTSASQKKEYSNVFVVFHSMCCLSQATWLSRYIKNIIDNFIFLHCRWKASNQTHVYINTDSYLWYITYHPQKLNIRARK